MSKAEKSTIKRKPQTTNVYMIGSGIGTLTAAVYLIRDAKVPGKNIHFFETLDVDGGSLDGSGNSRNSCSIVIFENGV